ncbi:MAG: glycine cleavage system aminomethyltransferase GcvT [Clostridia bacterium]|nr:glycine cleavage system aminomethyltransferase GcvT [Clostridia bacterium]
MQAQELKRTPLYSIHKEYGARITEFAGWEMPLQYQGIIPEHEAVRKDAGIFDVSHMGEIRVKGKESVDFLQYVITNDLDNINDGAMLYTPVCYHDGGVVDDVLIYKFSQTHYCVVVNASNREKDYKWFIQNAEGYDVSIDDISEQFCQLAIQGPKAETILKELTQYSISDIKFFNFRQDVSIAGVDCIVSRSGYTGEDGFEIYAPAGYAQQLWRNIIDSGTKHGLKPCGLGCRDTLRFEASLPLYGNEISKDITPLEAGLGIFVKLGKTDFIGKDALLEQKQKGVKRRIVGIEMKGGGIARHGYDVLYSDREIGFITTGYRSPSLKKNIALAMLDVDFCKIGTEVKVSIRKRMVDAVVIDRRFYNKNYKK